VLGTDAAPCWGTDAAPCSGTDAAACWGTYAAPCSELTPQRAGELTRHRARELTPHRAPELTRHRAPELTRHRAPELTRHRARDLRCTVLGTDAAPCSFTDAASCLRTDASYRGARFNSCPTAMSRARRSAEVDQSTAKCSAILKVRSRAIHYCGSGGTADALASGASWSNPVGVQIPPSAPYSKWLNHKYLVIEPFLSHPSMYSTRALSRHARR
jgi:hypothetical protein